MGYLVRIYKGTLEGRNSEAFRFTIKDYKKVLGAFSIGGNELSLVFNNGNTVLLRNFEQQKSLDVQPNKRPFLFERPLCMELITGVIRRIEAKSKEIVNVYLILEK